MRNLRLMHRFASTAKTSFALVGVGTVAAFIYEWINHENDNRTENNDTRPKRRRRVLYLPLHRMKIVEQTKPNFLSFLQSWKPFGKEDTEVTIEIGLHDLIETIHSAAVDNDIVALYGTLGQGFRFQCGGFAHLEEIRNAIRVFNESHRIHSRPLTSESPTFKKYSFVFADSFDNPSDPANKEYFLASAFSYIMLQPRGHFSLYGMTMTTPFLRKFLDKYGIKVHVFKYGKYKTAPNIATENDFNREHLENSKSILQSINHTITSGITFSRKMTTYSPIMWQALFNYGSLSAPNAQEVGLIDFMPNVNPLDDMIALNRTELNEGRKRWLHGIDLDHFQADELMTLERYRKLLRSRKRRSDRRLRMFAWMRYMAAKSSAAESVLSIVGYTSPYFNLTPEEEHESTNKASVTNSIAVVHVNGTITDSVARKTIESLKSIKEKDDVKCVILRIDSPGGSAVASEAILEQLKNLTVPYICSFGNVAASGGYYIASAAARIFALETTVTGSIGVFGVKLDLSSLASTYNVNVAHLSSSNHGTSYSLFSPLTDEMSENISRQLRRTYFYFRSIVSLGRKMSLEDVEKLAQGKVWLGKHAQYVGLVDDIGGITRAIAFAKREFTSGNAIIEYWPKAPSFVESVSRFFDSKSSFEGNDSTILPQYLLQSDPIFRLFRSCFQLSDPLFMTIDENAIIQFILANGDDKRF